MNETDRNERDAPEPEGLGQILEDLTEADLLLALSDLL